MFRYIGLMPQQPTYPTTLSGFNFTISDSSAGELKHRETGKAFDFFHTNSESANCLRKENFHQAVRDTVYDKLAASGSNALTRTYLSGPKGAHMTAQPPPKNTPCIPILTSSREALAKHRHVVIVIGQSDQDLGIWAWRIVTRQGVTAGTALGLLSDNNDPDYGLILLNPGQRYYSYRERRALTTSSWIDRRRDSAVAEAYHIHTTYNQVSGHGSAEEHIATALDKVVPQLVHPEARVHIVGIGDGAENVLTLLDQREEFLRRSGALALVESTHGLWKVKNEALAEHLGKLGRAWMQANVPLGTPLQEEEGGERFLCPTFSAGIFEEPMEIVFPHIKDEVLGFVKGVSAVGHQCW